MPADLMTVITTPLIAVAGKFRDYWPMEVQGLDEDDPRKYHALRPWQFVGVLPRSGGRYRLEYRTTATSGLYYAVEEIVDA